MFYLYLTKDVIKICLICQPYIDILSVFEFDFFTHILLNILMDANTALTNTLRKYREERDLTQSELSTLIDTMQLEPVSQNLISRIEKGTGDTTTEKLKAICIALKVSPEDLLFGEEENAGFLYRPTNGRAKESRPPRPAPEEPHETIKTLSDLNYRLASEGKRLEADELAAIEALLKTCLKSLHKELKKDTESQPAKTA
ncbi:MAG: helix-turn-helix transcriptional regulator [bacterium]|nr:helix-turn-helix transcriptional regulator [bacterium]